MQDPVTYEREKNQNGVKAMVDKYIPLVLSKLDWGRVHRGNILDYGCGAGSTGYQHILPKVIQSDSTLYSVDISEKMLDFAKNNYHHDRIKYSVGNILEEFPFQDVKFDKIVTCNVFNLIADIRKALKEFHLILKEEGQLGFLFPFQTVATRTLRTLQYSKRFEEYMKDYEKFYPDWSSAEDGVSKTEQITRLLKEEGFKVSFMEIRPIHLPMTFDMLTSFTLSLNPCQIPEDIQTRFETEVRKILAEHQGHDWNEINEGKSCIFSFDYMACVAEKI